MDIYVVRHGFSAANNRDNQGTLAFGARDAHLEEAGIEHARGVRETLLSQYAVDITREKVATSTYTRAIETATEAGALQLANYPLLDELEPEQTGIPRENVRAVIASRKFPKAVMDEIDKTLERPPAERIWVTHGLRIAALCVALHQDEQFADLKPAFGEVRKLTLPDNT